MQNKSHLTAVKLKKVRIESRELTHCNFDKNGHIFAFCLTKYFTNRLHCKKHPNNGLQFTL